MRRTGSIRLTDHTDRPRRSADPHPLPGLVTLKEAGEIMGVSASRAGQLETKALIKLWRGLWRDRVMRRLARQHGIDWDDADGGNMGV